MSTFSLSKTLILQVFCIVNHRSDVCQQLRKYAQICYNQTIYKWLTFSLLLRAGIVFAGVCLSVCPHKIPKTTDQKLMNLVGMCPVVNARTDIWPWLLTFDLDSSFRIFPAQSIRFQWLCLSASIFVWKHIFRISRSWFSFKVIDPESRSLQRKSSSVQLRNYWSETVWVWWEYSICYDVTPSISQLLTFSSWDISSSSI